METSLAELLLVAAAIYALYRLLTPLQRRLEQLLLDLLLGKGRILEAETVATKKTKRKD